MTLPSKRKFRMPGSPDSDIIESRNFNSRRIKVGKVKVDR